MRGGGCEGTPQQSTHHMIQLWPASLEQTRNAGEANRLSGAALPLSGFTGAHQSTHASMLGRYGASWTYVRPAWQLGCRR